MTPAPAPAAEVPPPVASPAPAAEPPPPAPPPPPPDAEKDEPALTISAWGRFGFWLQGFGADADSPEDITHEAEIDLLFEAKIIEMVGLTANFVGTYGMPPGEDSITGNINIMDLIAKFNFDDAFHLWAGRMLVPSDRSNFSGPWFMAPWNYPGFFDRYGIPTGPRQGPNGRNDGATVWGQAAGGTFKYYAGAYNLFDNTSAPLFSGRLSLSLLNPEPGYYGSSTFYGKDLLGIGLGAQYQKDGAPEDDYSEINVDVLFEKDLGAAGVLDLEGAFYKYMGEGLPLDFTYFALASYLIRAKVGPGMFQPLIRYQGAVPTDDDADASTLIDVQLGYVVAAYACRFALGYQYGDVGGQEGHSVFLGIQLMK